MQNVPIPFALPAGLEGTYLRMSDGTLANSYPGDWSTAPWLNPFLGGVWFANSPLLRPVITGTDQIVNLALGTPIGLGNNFVAGESGSTTHVGPAANQFQIGSAGLVGFVFENSGGGASHYGWLRMTADNVNPGTIVDWAYETTAGASLLAGISSVPEPGTLCVGLALCAVGVLRRRRRA